MFKKNPNFIISDRLTGIPVAGESFKNFNNWLEGTSSRTKSGCLMTKANFKFSCYSPLKSMGNCVKNVIPVFSALLSEEKFECFVRCRDAMHRHQSIHNRMKGCTVPRCPGLQYL